MNQYQQLMELTVANMSVWLIRQWVPAEERGPPLVDEAGVLHEACVYVSLQVFPPTVLHPILFNKGPMRERAKMGVGS